MVGWHHWLNGHEFEQTPGDSEGQWRLACCSPWSLRVRHDLVTKQVLLLEWSNIFYYKVPFPIWEWILINYTIQNICTELQQTNDTKTFWTSIKKVYSRAFWPLKSTFMCGNNKIYIRVLTATGRGLHKCSESITSFKLLNNSIQFSSIQSLSRV